MNKKAFNLFKLAQALGNLYVHIATLALRSGERKKAIDCLDQAVDIFTKNKGKNCIENSLALNNLGVIHQQWGNDGESLKYHLKALDISQTIHHDLHINCSTLYFNIAKIYSRRLEYDEAAKNFTLYIKSYVGGHG